MMRAAQPSGSYAEFMSEAQRFLASDDEECFSFAGDSDETPVVRSSSYGDGRGLEPPPHRNGMEDSAWAVAFAMNAVVTALSAFCFRGTAFTALSHTLQSRGWRLTESDNEGAKILVVCLLVVPLAHATSSSIVNAFASCSKRILQVIGAVFVSVSFAVVCFLCSCGAARSAVVFSGVCAVMGHLFFSRRGRINFAAANLKVAAVVVKATPQISSWALFMIGIRIAWLAMVSVAAYGSIVSFQTVHATNGASYRAADCHSGSPQKTVARPCECNGNIISDNVGCNYSDPNYALVYFWLMSAMWGSAVIGKVMAATLTESVASWWSSPSRAEPVWKSFDRVIHPSLGSLCKEAVVAGLLQPMYFVVILLSHVDRVVRCPLVCMRLDGRYVSEDVVYWSSIYNVNCSEAARRFGALFSTNGLVHFHTETLVVVSVGGALLSIAMFTVVIFGITGQGASSLALTALPDPRLAIVYGAVVVTFVTTLEVVMCVFKEVFTCFVQDPEAFAASHDHWLQGGMYRSWQQLQLLPSTMGEAQGGGHA